MKKLSVGLFVVASMVVFVSCGGGVKSKYFGEVPGLVKEFYEEGEALSAKYSFDEKTTMKDLEKYMVQVDKLKSEYEQKILSAGEKIVGTEIAYSAPEGLPYEISVPKITGVDAFSSTQFRVMYELKMKLDKDTVLVSEYQSKYTKFPAYLTLYYKLLDNAGNVIDIDKSSLYSGKDGDVLPAGSEYSVEEAIYFSAEDEEDMVRLEKNANLEKIVFIDLQEYEELKNKK